MRDNASLLHFRIGLGYGSNFYLIEPLLNNPSFFYAVTRIAGPEAMVSGQTHV